MVDIRLGGNEVSQIMAGSGPSSAAAGRGTPRRSPLVLGVPGEAARAANHARPRCP